MAISDEELIPVEATSSRNSPVSKENKLALLLSTFVVMGIGHVVSPNIPESYKLRHTSPTITSGIGPYETSSNTEIANYDPASLGILPPRQKTLEEKMRWLSSKKPKHEYNAAAQAHPHFNLTYDILNDPSIPYPELSPSLELVLAMMDVETRANDPRAYKASHHDPMQIANDVCYALPVLQANEENTFILDDNAYLGNVQPTPTVDGQPDYSHVNKNTITPYQSIRGGIAWFKSRRVGRWSELYTPILVHKHTVEQGDTLYDIARAYNSTVQEIMSANKGLDPRKLRVGKELEIFELHREIIPTNFHDPIRAVESYGGYEEYDDKVLKELEKYL